MVLALQASDWRNSSEIRARATAALERMPEYALPTGLAATCSAETLEFIRKFDLADHDPAATWREYQVFRDRMVKLFLGAHVFADPGAGMGMTPLHIILQQAREAPPPSSMAAGCCTCTANRRVPSGMLWFRACRLWSA